MAKEYALDTRCVHAGELEDPQGSPHTPIYNSTTFAFPNTENLLDVVEGRREGILYTRYGLNPSIRSLETKLATLEGAEAAFAFASGMAAESALFLAHGRDGIVCIGDAYGGTLELIADQLPLLGIPTHFLLGNELDQFESLLANGARVVFFETPSNPTLEIFDIAAIAEQAHRHNALLVVDNTFASPVNQQPLALGADLVVHSATKYLGGHSDITAGALMGDKALLDPIWGWRKNLGQMPAPETATLLARRQILLGQVGIRFRLGVSVDGATLSRLLEDNDAVFLGLGPRRPRNIDLPGQTLPGVEQALRWLERINAGEREPLNEQRVLVIGGGYTAMDCARATRRLGAEATVAYRGPEECLRAAPKEITLAREDGVGFLFHQVPLACEGNSSVRGVRFETPEGAVVVDANRVILALSQQADPPAWLEDLGVATGADGRVRVDNGGHTTHPGIWAGGDNTLGPNLAVNAMAAGRTAAENILTAFRLTGRFRGRA